MDIGTLTGAIAIEDQVSDKLTLVAEHVKQFAEGFEGAFGAMAVGVGVVVGAVVGAVVSIEHLGERGSVILGVEENFNKLAAAAGTTGDALRGGLSEGVRGTVDEMTLMQSTARLLSSGMKLTAEDTLLMGEASRAMGRATGTDAAQGLGTLSSALLTGRTRSLAMAGIVVDLKGHEEAFAKTLGVTTSELSREGKLEADRGAILEATRAYVDRLGISQLTFKERVQQGRVAVEEWTARLEKSVASSPHVMAALDSIGAALVKAFGGDSQSMLETIVGWVDSFADAVARYGPPIIQTVADIWHGVQDLWETIKASWDDLPDWFKNIARDSTLAAAGVALVGNAYVSIDWSGWLSSLSNLAQVWSTWGATLVAFPAKTVAAIASQYALATASGTLAGSFTALLAPIALVASAVAGLAVTLYAGKVAWDIWRTSSDTAATAARTHAQEQQNLISINKQFGMSFTDYGTAVKYAQLQMKELNQGHKDFIGPVQVVTGEVKKQTASFIDNAEKAKKAAEAWAKIVKEDTIPAMDAQQVHQKLLASGIEHLESRTLAFGAAQLKLNIVTGDGDAGRAAFISDVGTLGSRVIRTTRATTLYSSALGGQNKEIESGRTKLEKLHGAIGPIEEVLGGINNKWAEMATVGVRAVEAISTKLAEGDWVGAIAAGVGALIGFGQALFGVTEESKKVSPVREEFFKLQGGLESLNPRVLELTGNLELVDAIFKAKTVDEYKAAIDDLNEAFAFSDAAMKTLDETTKKYGFTIEELGPAMQRQELDKQAQQLFKDYSVLNAAGIDHTKVIGHMSDAINDYVHRALSMGQEVPIAMKPMLESMVEQGLLTDAAGTKITDLEGSGVSFAMTMSEGFKALIGVVEKLTDAISRGLGLAIQNIPEPVVHGRVDWQVNKIPPPEYEAGGGVIYAAAGASILPFVPRGTDTVPVMATPGERVLSVAQNHAYETGQQPSNSDVVDAIDGLRGDLNSKVPRAIARSVETALVGLRTAS